MALRSLKTYEQTTVWKSCLVKKIKKILIWQILPKCMATKGITLLLPLVENFRFCLNFEIARWAFDWFRWILEKLLKIRPAFFFQNLYNIIYQIEIRRIKIKCNSLIFAFFLEWSQWTLISFFFRGRGWHFRKGLPEHVIFTSSSIKIHFFQTFNDDMDPSSTEIFFCSFKIVK